MGSRYFKPRGIVFVWDFRHLHCWAWGASPSAEGAAQMSPQGHTLTSTGPCRTKGTKGCTVYKKEFCDAVTGDSKVSTTVTQSTSFTHRCSYFWCQDVNELLSKSKLKHSNSSASVRADSKSNLCFWATLPSWEALLTVMDVTHQNALTQFW